MVLAYTKKYRFLAKNLRQHRIILSADAASEKYKLLSKKRR